MDEYISKKDLLELTGISYGQLYRWKRMDIIPESWFIKKSSFTGQETFFPKDKILARIQKIVELKDEYSLDELAKFFSPNPSEIELSEDTLLTHKIISETALKTYKTFHSGLGSYPFESIYYMYICQEVAGTSALTIEECYQTLTFIQDYYKEHRQTSLELLALQKDDHMAWLMFPIQTPVVFEHQVKVKYRFNLLDLNNDLKMRLSGIHSN